MQTDLGIQTVFPHEHIRVNTIFEVARQNGLATAYADKHLTYSFVAGPSGLGLVEGYFPEVSAVDATDQAQSQWLVHQADAALTKA